MAKQKFLVIGGSLLVIAGSVAGSVVFFTHRKSDAPVQSAYNSTMAASSGANVSATQATTPSAGSLSVTPSTPSGSTTQLLGSGSGASNTQGTSQSSTSASSSSNSASSAFDPSTFAGYDKYQTATSALFADAQVGTGTELTSGQQASVYYKGWLTNGTLFDESKTNSNGQLEPFTFTEGGNQVITGWEQGLAGMKVGGTRLLIVPPAVGYGSTAQGSIPANSVLVFEVQLVAVQ